MKLRSISFGLFCLVSLAGLSACSAEGFKWPWQEMATPIPTPVVTIEPTTVPEKEMTICLGEEPESLFIYAGQQSYAMWSILEAVYDGPIDRTRGGYTAVILQKIPTYEDGDLTLVAATITAGDFVVDASNQIIAFETGARVLPAGCNDNSCVITWDGVSEIQMDQVTANYTLRANLVWSDGTPLKAADSLFSYAVNSDPVTASVDARIDLTDTYEALDDSTVQWKGIPGYRGIDATGMFWIPLPEHMLGDLPPTQLATSDLAARQPLGWGPYVISEWVAGEYIRLQKNDHYFRSEEGYPRFDRIIYRFIGQDSGASLAALASGQCDLVERSSDPQTDLDLVSDLLNSTDILAESSASPEIYQLVFGVKPASHDDGYNAAFDRLDFFRDPATRRALATCIDRQALNGQVFAGSAGLASISDMLGNQAGGAGEALPVYNLAAAAELLTQAGWVDNDGDPATPRLSVNVIGVPTGSPLSLKLLTPSDFTSIAIASGAADSLRKCGIDVSITAVPFSELYAPGPDGLVFGRSFDLALINWQYSLVPACYLFTTPQIPGTGNYWIGGNVAGYSNNEFDIACSGLMKAMPGDGDYELYLQKAVEYFSKDWPAIPLFKLPKLVLARPDFCAFTFDPFARSDLTNLELFDYGPGCSSR
jgi:peptide/nickel transport system substrate-binding protein